METHASLARTAALLTSARPPDQISELAKPGPADFGQTIELTAWGPARRMMPPITIEGIDLRWERPATALGSTQPNW
jgi:hypothetical protein